MLKKHIYQEVSVLFIITSIARKVFVDSLVIEVLIILKSPALPLRYKLPNYSYPLGRERLLLL